MMLRPYPPITFFLCVTGAILSWLLLPQLNFITAPYTWPGIAPIVIGCWLLLTASQRFKKVGTNILPFNKPDVLVTHFPFNVSRNPMYLGFLCLLLGAALMFGNFAAFVFVAVFFGVINTINIPFEEQLCEATLGDDYIRYKASVRRWL